MLPYAYYLLKVIACSGILFGYYWLVLRNKNFHAWNRFYLLASVLLSLLLPFIKINYAPADPGTIVQVLQRVASGDEYMENVIIHSSYATWHIDQLYPFLYAAVSALMLVIFLHGLFQILRLIKKFPSQKVESISLINTDAKGTPFSFLNYIFWNRNIDIDSTTGNQVFRHEVAHVREKHTHDKLFINCVLIFFWCNPFFWIMRKELNMIHEFIADKKAIEDNDTSAFAAMILQATYPQHRFQLSNNFFYSPIKRRLAMLTKKNNPRVNYISRLSALALTIVVFAAFTIKTNSAVSIMDPGITGIEMPGDLPAETFTMEVLDDTLPNRVPLETEYARKGTIKEITLKEEEKIQLGDDVLYVVNGKIVGIGKKGMDQLNQLTSPEDILELRILKGEAAIKKYGAVGGNGVLEFNTKTQLTVKNVPAAPLDEVVMVGYQKPSIENITIVPATVTGAVKEVTVTGYKNSKKVQGIELSPSVTNVQRNNLQEVTVTGYATPRKVQTIELTPGLASTQKSNLQEVTVVGYATAKKVPGVELTPAVTNLALQPDDRIFTKVEIEAAFPGGADAWKLYLMKNVKGNTPIDEGWKAGVYQVIVQFIVYSDGTVGDVKTLNYTGSKTAAHCIDIIKNGPKWRPALQNGKQVAAFRKQPITFVVEEQK